VQGPERCIVVRTQEGEERARATVRRQAQRDQQTWEKRLWHLGNQTFACQPDADAALATAWQRLPPSFVVMSVVTSQVGYAARGRPRTGATPTTQGWRIQATLTRDPVALEQEALRRAAFLVGTNLLDTAAWPDEAIIAVYCEQSVVERGFAFLKDPLYLASSVFVKRPERIMALAFVMTLCLLVYTLAEVRLRRRLAETGQTVPDQVRKPTARPTLRWLFQYYEGIDLLYITHPHGTHMVRRCGWRRSTAWSCSCWDPPTKTPFWPSRKLRIDGHRAATVLDSPSTASAAARPACVASKARAMRAAPSRMVIALRTASRSRVGFRRLAGKRVPACATSTRRATSG